MRRPRPSTRCGPRWTARPPCRRAAPAPAPRAGRRTRLPDGCRARRRRRPAPRQAPRGAGAAQGDARARRVPRRDPRVPIVFGGWIASQSVYFVGTDDEGFVTLYRGMPYELPGGVEPVQRELHLRRAGDSTLGDKVTRHRDRAQAALARRRRRTSSSRSSRASWPARAGDVVSARTRELFALIPAALLLSAGFAAIFLSRGDLLGGLDGTNEVSTVSLTYGGDLPRRLLRRAPRPAHRAARTRTRTCSRSSRCWRAFGLVEIYRIDADLARQQAQWFVIGVGAMRGDDRRAARLPQARAVPLHDRARRDRPAAAAAPLLADQRRLPGDQRRLDLDPARGVRQDRDRRLPRELPA